jgi:O-6-methylguanine DNA methyltransferase
MKTKPGIVELPVKTAEGEFSARYSEKGLVEVDFPMVGRAPSRAAIKQVVPAQIRGWHRMTETALKNVLAGRAAGKLPPLDWSDKTEFQKSVWRELQKISLGKTKSYGEIAEAIGRPKAVRAVGGACGANPIPMVVPCHRVLAANKKLGGFSGGLEWKRNLLAIEGVDYLSSSTGKRK